MSEEHMETPPSKRQRLATSAQELSSPLVHSPQHNSVVEDHQIDSPAENTPQPQNEEENNEVTDETTENNMNHSMTALSPLKLNPRDTSDIDDDINNNEVNDATPSFKQLITRFHNIVEEATSASNEIVSVEETDDTNESYSLVQFGTLKNKYDSTINEFNIKLQKQLTTINELNNEIANYKQKVENMHLSIEQSQIDNSNYLSQNELLKLEIQSLNNTIATLDNKLTIEKSKNSSLISKINQLNESVSPLFSNYESNYNQINELRVENSKLQNTVTQQQVKISSFDDTLKNELELLAQELYIQYAEKHESKISKLRTAYESKYAKKHQLFNEKLQLLQDQHKTLQQELAHVKNRLQVETNEKHQLVKLWDEYVALDKKDVDQMSSFVKRLK